MTESEFLKEVKNIHKKRHIKKTDSLRIRDGYNFYVHAYPLEDRIPLNDYLTIHREVNNLIADLISKGGEFDLPYGLGKIWLSCKTKIKSSLDKCPVDWPATLKLWYEDAEAKESKFLVRKLESTWYKTKFSKNRYNYKYAAATFFKTCRSLKKRIVNAMNNNEINTL